LATPSPGNTLSAYAFVLRWAGLYRDSQEMNSASECFRYMAVFQMREARLVLANYNDLLKTTPTVLDFVPVLCQYGPAFVDAMRVGSSTSGFSPWSLFRNPYIS
jgi:hypothetical protein